MKDLPSALRLARQNLRFISRVMIMIIPAAIMQAMMPGTYLGASSVRKTVPPMIPPTPPAPTSVAEQRARFHCPLMLLACHVSTQGTLALAAAVARKTPKYLP